MKIFFLSFISICLITGCSSSKKAKLDLSSEGFIESVVEEHFKGEPVDTIYNQNRDFAIIVNRIERGVGYPVAVNFVVVDLLKKKVLYMESISDGSVSWIDNDIVLIKRVPGAMSTVEEENRNAKRTEINVREL